MEFLDATTAAAAVAMTLLSPRATVIQKALATGTAVCGAVAWPRCRDAALGTWLGHEVGLAAAIAWYVGRRRPLKVLAAGAAAHVARALVLGAPWIEVSNAALHVALSVFHLHL